MAGATERRVGPAGHDDDGLGLAVPPVEAAIGPRRGRRGMDDLAIETEVESR